MEYEFKVVRVPRNNPRGRQRILNREATDGWEFVEGARGATLSLRDTVTFRRPRVWKAVQREARRQQRQVAVLQAEERRRNKPPRKHTHDWVDQTSADDRRNSVRYEVCAVCGIGQTISA